MQTIDATTIEREKTAVALAAAARVERRMIVGLGSGSTALKLVDALGRRVADGFECVAVATSEQTAARARRWDIPLIADAVPAHIDLVIDGADEFDGELRLIKGGGGMLLREKIVASAAARMLVMVDHTKQVETLGAFPLPVEVVPMARARVKHHLRDLKLAPEVRRMADGQPFITDEGNVIIDCRMGRIDEPEALAARLSGIPGVVEHGLFLDLADEVLMATGETVQRFTRR